MNTWEIWGCSSIRPLEEEDIMVYILKILEKRAAEKITEIDLHNICTLVNEQYNLKPLFELEQLGYCFHDILDMVATPESEDYYCKMLRSRTFGFGQDSARIIMELLSASTLLKIPRIDLSEICDIVSRLEIKARRTAAGIESHLYTLDDLSTCFRDMCAVIKHNRIANFGQILQEAYSARVGQRNEEGFYDHAPGGLGEVSKNCKLILDYVLATEPKNGIYAVDFADLHRDLCFSNNIDEMVFPLILMTQSLCRKLDNGSQMSFCMASSIEIEPETAIVRIEPSDTYKQLDIRD